MKLSALSTATALLVALTLPLNAQDTAAPAGDAGAATEEQASEGTDFSTGEEVGEESPIYVAETQGDWEVRCVKQPSGFDPCQIYQLLKDQNGNDVAELTMVSLPDGAEAAAGATLLTPLETLLTQAVTFSIDGGKAKRYPFTWCDRFGCYSRIGFTAGELAALKNGKNARMTIVPMVAPDQKVELNISLIGVTKAFEAMRTRNIAAAEGAAAAQQEAPAEGAPTEQAPTEQAPAAGGN